MSDDVQAEVVASGLRFPEGPVARPDGSVLVVEIARGTLSSVAADGTVTVVAECGGGPNGAAIGPDGAAWLCNNGGFFEWNQVEELTFPGATPTAWSGGSLQRVDLDTGAVETVATESQGQALLAPNDLVFDRDGGIWFTDHGCHRREPRRPGRGAVPPPRRHGRAGGLRDRVDQRDRPVPGR